MRPIIIEQNAFRYPLNIILGTEARVRLLRIMISEVSGPITAADAAERAGITPQGAAKAIKKLIDAGVVKTVGGGCKKQYIVSWNDILVQSVTALFAAETVRFEHILDSIRKHIKKVEPHPISAWMTSLPTEMGYPIKICILQDARNLRMTIQNLRILFQELEKELDMTIELIGYTKAEKPQQESGSLHLYGIQLTGDIKVEIGIMSGFASHEKHNRRLNEICRKIGKMISEDRSIIERAKQHTRRILKGQSDSATGEIEEWRDILKKYSVRHLVKFLSSDEERAVRLRQSCPFLAVLNETEKERILEELGDE